MKLKSRSLASTLIAAPLAAWAQQAETVAAPVPPVTGPYVSFGGGGNFLQGERFVGQNGEPNASLESHFGGVAVSAIGYGLGNGLRVEIIVR